MRSLACRSGSRRNDRSRSQPDDRAPEGSRYYEFVFKMADRLRPHRQAALAYAGLGVLVIAITFAAGLVPASRRSAVWELAIGAAFVVVFAILIYRGWWVVSAALMPSNLWRVVTYLNDGLGQHLEIFPFSVTPIQPRPVAFVNAALMIAIVIMLARSALAGYSTWQASRSKRVKDPRELGKL